MPILIKSTFSDLLFLGRSFVRLWFILGLLPEEDREGTKERNLKKRYKGVECRVVKCKGRDITRGVLEHTSYYI